MNNEQEFYFKDQGIIFAYAGNNFAGVLVTNPDETFTKTELMDYFEDANADYLVAANLSEWFYSGSEDEVQERLEFLIDLASNGDTTHLKILYRIPKHLH